MTEFNVGDIIKDCNRGRGFITAIKYDKWKKPQYVEINWFITPNAGMPIISWMPSQYIIKYT